MSHSRQSGILALTLLPGYFGFEDRPQRRTVRGRLWGRLEYRLSTWRRHERSRRELINLSDRILRDIGLTRGEAISESPKPFWLP